MVAGCASGQDGGHPAAAGLARGSVRGGASVRDRDDRGRRGVPRAGARAAGGPRAAAVPRHRVHRRRSAPRSAWWGCCPAAESSLDSQVARVYAQYARQPDDLSKNLYLTPLRDRNEVLFYRLLGDHVEEMLPIIYTPTIGEAIERYSHEYRRPRGRVPVDRPAGRDRAVAGQLRPPRRRGRPHRGHRLRGHPRHRRPGRRRRRDRHRQADRLHRRRRHPPAPRGPGGARRRHRQPGPAHRPAVPRQPPPPGARRAVRRLHRRLRPGRAAPVPERAAALGGLRGRERPPDPRALLRAGPAPSTTTCRAPRRSPSPRPSRACAPPGRGCATSGWSSSGPGTAGVGIADFLREAMERDGLSREEATRRIWLVGRRGLLTADMETPLRDFQAPYVRPAGEHPAAVGVQPTLEETVRQVRPTMLIGTSTLAGAFSEPLVRELAAHVERPIIFPMSNPTSKIEALPADLLAWTGRPGARGHRQPVPAGRARRRDATASRRPTTPSSSRASGSASRSPGPGASATGCCRRPPTPSRASST